MIQEIRIKLLDAKVVKLKELYSVKKFLKNKNDESYVSQWNFTINNLEKIYSYCRKRNIQLVLLIFPYTFQFDNTALSWPQELLKDNATANNIMFIDYLKIFQDEFNLTEVNANKYFLDQDHFNISGHQVVANRLSRLIISLYN